MVKTWHVSEIKMNLSRVDDIPVIEASGECDLITSRKLKDTANGLIDGDNVRLILDLGGMTYIDSSGFQVLVALQKKANAAGGGIVLSGLPERIRRILGILKLRELLPTAMTIESAVDLLKSRP